LPLDSAGLSLTGASALFVVSCPEFEPAGEPLADGVDAGAVLGFSVDPAPDDPEPEPPVGLESELSPGLDAFFLVSRGGSSPPLLPIPTGTSSAFRVVFGASVPFGK
jgi:hypothetical protein